MRIMLATLAETFSNVLKNTLLLENAHNQKNKDLWEQFAKCRGKFESLIYEMLFIQENKPELNTQTDSKQNYLVPYYYPLRSTV